MTSKDSLLISAAFIGIIILVAGFVVPSEIAVGTTWQSKSETLIEKENLIVEPVHENFIKVKLPDDAPKFKYALEHEEIKNITITGEVAETQGRKFYFVVTDQNNLTHYTWHFEENESPKFFSFSLNLEEAKNIELYFIAGNPSWTENITVEISATINWQEKKVETITISKILYPIGLTITATSLIALTILKKKK